MRPETTVLPIRPTIGTSALDSGPNNGANSTESTIAIVSAAIIANADAIHPGYGFLSEDANFASIVEEHGFTFIGPSPDHIRVMGDKIAAKSAMVKAGVPVVPGSDDALDNAQSARRMADEIGYPVLLKAAGGGGGRGMKIIERPDEVADAFSAARSEAAAYFGNDTIYMEKFLTGPRHIEIQVMADSAGNVVSLGERDCSLQRRHQKVLDQSILTIESQKNLMLQSKLLSVLPRQELGLVCYPYSFINSSGS